MKKHEIFEAVIKLIGVYCLVLSLRGIITITMSIISFQENYNISFSHAISPILTGIYYFVLFFLSYIFIRRTYLILKILDISTQQDEKEKTIEALICGQLSFWLRIIGLFYFVSSTPYVVTHLLGLILSLDLSTPQQSQVIADTVQPMIVNIVIFTLSLFFIFKNQYIEAILTRKISDEI